MAQKQGGTPKLTRSSRDKARGVKRPYRATFMVCGCPYCKSMGHKLDWKS